MKEKYLKYKNKYNILKSQIGGSHKIIIIPENIPATQSWFYMPILLAPFNNVLVNFDNKIENFVNQLKNNSFISINLKDCIEKIKSFYKDKGVNLNDFNDLKNFSFNFDGQYHLPADQQEYLLNYSEIRAQLDFIIQYMFTKENNELLRGCEIILMDYKGSHIFIKKYKDNFHGITIKRKINIISQQSCEIIKNKDEIKNTILQNNIDVYLRPIDDPLWKIKDQALIVFGGWGDRQYNLYTILKNYKGYVIYFSDKYNEWYSGLISSFIQFINEFTVTINKLTFLGWSMGGYAALHSSVYFPGKECICISMVPQTINYKNYNNKIIIKQNADYKSNSNPKPLVESIELMYKDIPTVLNEHPHYTTKIYTMVGKSECDDYNIHNTHLLIDSLHIGAIINYPNVSSIIYNIASHRFLEKINFIDLLNIIENDFNILFSNQNSGNKLLSDHVKQR